MKLEPKTLLNSQWHAGGSRPRLVLPPGQPDSELASRILIIDVRGPSHDAATVTVVPPRRQRPTAELCSLVQLPVPGPGLHSALADRGIKSEMPQSRRSGLNLKTLYNVLPF